MAPKKPAESGMTRTDRGSPMKARRRKTRWLLAALLLGFLAATGFALTHHHRAGTEAARSPLVPPQRATLPPAPTPLLASIAGKSTARVLPSERVLERAPGVGHPQSFPAEAPADSIQPRGAGDSRPSLQVSRNLAPGVAGAAPRSQNGAGGFVYESHVRLACVPAGCGANTNINASTNQPNPPISRDGPPGGSGSSRGSGRSDGSGPPAGSWPAGESAPPGGSAPPGATDPLAAAPELDPTMLAGALTLLLGALLIVRSRRVRASR